VDDLVGKQQLNASATTAHQALGEMINAIKRVAEATGAREIEQAVNEAETAAANMDALLLSAEVGMLETTGRNLDAAVQKLTAASNALAQSSGELRDAAVNHPERMGPTSATVGDGVARIGDSAKEVAEVRAMIGGTARVCTRKCLE
jgi:hypothetical protein